MSKVCFITSIHRERCAATRTFWCEALSLRSQGFEVTWIAPCEQAETFSDSVKILGFHSARSRLGRWLSMWRPVVMALGERADIYHFHDPELIPVGLMLRLITRKPVIYDVYEHYPDAIRLKEWLPYWARNFMARLFDWMESWTAPFFTAIITADDAIASRFQKVRRVVILYNFPRADFTATQMSPKPKRVHPVQLIYVGSIYPERGQWLMLDMVRILVAEKHLDVGLWLLGRFDSEEKRQEFMEVVDSDKLLRGRVVCPGIVSQSQLGAWLESADVGLVPLQPVAKFHKNIPTKMFEYMAAGLPIVGSDLPPIRKFIMAANAGCLAVPADPRSHAEKILSLVQNPELARQMGRNGRSAFRARYNWTSEEEKLVSLYRELLNLP